VLDAARSEAISNLLKKCKMKLTLCLGVSWLQVVVQKEGEAVGSLAPLADLGDESCEISHARMDILSCGTVPS